MLGFVETPVAEGPLPELQLSLRLADFFRLRHQLESCTYQRPPAKFHYSWASSQRFEHLPRNYWRYSRSRYCSMKESLLTNCQPNLRVQQNNSLRLTYRNLIRWLQTESVAPVTLGEGRRMKQ